MILSKLPVHRLVVCKNHKKETESQFIVPEWHLDLLISYTCFSENAKLSVDVLYVITRIAHNS